MKSYTYDQRAKALSVDLYSFLLNHHGSSVRKEADSLRLLSNHSVSVKRGYRGYRDFETDETGNNIDFLVNHMGYTVVDAVLALCNECDDHTERTAVSSDFVKVPPIFPESLRGTYKQLYAYLIKRGIQRDTIDHLIAQRLIYQSESHNNIVFINRERDWAEIHGTYTYSERSYHGIAKNSRHDGFWWFRTARDAEIVYVCEAAIDAISLYELHRIQGVTKPAFYASIGGVGKQDTINRIKKQKQTIIAVDNDSAGEACRRRNAELESIIPIHKDWNDDLNAIIR